MILSQVWLTRFLKSVPSVVVVEVEVVAAEMVMAVEVVGTIGTRTKTQALPLQGRDTQVPDTLTFLKVMSPNSALCIISGGEEVTFVHLQPLVRGRMCTRPDLNNETGTSPV